MLLREKTSASAKADTVLNTVTGLCPSSGNSVKQFIGEAELFK